MMGRDLIRPDAERHGALVMTDRARPILRGEEQVQLRKDMIARATERRPAVKELVGEEHAPMFSALKSRRTALAREAQVPPYMIFNDKTLIEMAETRPATLDQMARINGVGARKLESYGAAFLEVLTGAAEDTHPRRRKLAARGAGELYDALMAAQSGLLRGPDGDRQAVVLFRLDAGKAGRAPATTAGTRCARCWGPSVPTGSARPSGRSCKATRSRPGGPPAPCITAFDPPVWTLGAPRSTSATRRSRGRQTVLIVISPAKRLDWTERTVEMTAPAFEDDARRLARTARNLTLKDLKGLMDLSDDLARLNRDRFRAFTDTPGPEDLRPAALAFAGDTYQGLEAASLEPEELDWAQDHLRILSGLYGLLRPLDGMQAYRLEMGSRLRTRRGANLYDYWRDRIAGALNAQAEAMGTDILVNCASQEYFGAVPDKALKLRVITPQFMEDKPAGPKIVSFFAKKARGAMARFIVQRRLTDPKGLTDFDLGGYCYQPEMSDPDRPVFLRPAEAQALSA